MLSKLFKAKRRNDCQLMAVIEYPGRFIFETYFQLESWQWKRTDLVTIAPKDCRQEEKFKLILHHLSMSKAVREKDYDFNQIKESYKQKLALTSLKKQMEGARMVQVSREHNYIRFMPMKNGGTNGFEKGFSPIKEKEMIIKEEDVNVNSINSCLIKSLSNT